MMRQLAIALCCIVVACAAEVKLARQQVAGARNGATYSASTRQAMVPGRFNGGFADFNGPYVNGYFGRAPFGGVQPPFGFNPVNLLIFFFQFVCFRTRVSRKHGVHYQFIFF